MAKQAVSFNLNGKTIDVLVEPRELLIHTLREQLNQTGAHIGCESSHCGACTVDIDGESVKSCTLLTVQAHGSEVKSVEGLADAEGLHAVQEAFFEEHGLQCGFCTPGMPTEEEIRWGMSGNLCRCTGYQNIIKAVQSAAQKLQA